MATCLGNDWIGIKDSADHLSKCKDFALSNGVSMRPRSGDENMIECAPFTLFPSVVSRAAFNLVKTSMVHFNRLMHKVAHDHDFLVACLKNVIEVDELTKRLWDIYTTVRAEGINQPVSLGLFRNDFMFSQQKDGTQYPKQIEFNTMASAFAGLVTVTVQLHRFSLNQIGHKFDSTQIPDNDPALGLAGGFVKAWSVYNNPKSVILFMVSDNVINVVDQRWLQFKVYELEPSIRVLRATFSDLQRRGSLRQGRLFLDEDEVSVVYFRVGYSTHCYKNEQDWEMRLLIERSRAIKCPSIQYHLSGLKKIQQELSRPGALERFISDGEVVSLLRSTFLKQYSTDLGPEGDEAVKMAIKEPHNFVLKPQREGGGNNLFGDEIVPFLKKHSTSNERNAYILMERIFPAPQDNYLIKPGLKFESSQVVSEFGVYGVYIGSKDEEMKNEECGHMLRTKILGTDEGGICAGFSGIDSPYVVDDNFLCNGCSQ